MGDEHESRFIKIENTLELMGRAVDRLVTQGETLIRIEERQTEIKDSVGRAFCKIEEQDHRISEIEMELPQLKEARGWLISGLAMSAMALLGAFLNLVMRT